MTVFFALYVFSCLFSLGINCPPSFNPADYYIHTLAVIPGREEESRREIKVSAVLISISMNN